MKLIFPLTLLFFLSAALPAQESAPLPQHEDAGRYRQLVRDGISAMEADSLERAEQLLRDALRADPTAQGNAILWGHLAAIAERTGREHEALEAYVIALGLSPETPALLLGRASLYLKLGNNERAQTDYTTLLEQWTDHPEALLLRGYVRQRLRQYRDARTDYEHLLRLQPDHEQALLGLALVNDADLRPREAMENVSRVIEVYPDHADAYALRAGMEVERQQYELAELDYAEAIRLSPNNPSLYLARAHFFMKMKRKREARADAQRAAQLGASAGEVAGAISLRSK